MATVTEPIRPETNQTTTPERTTAPRTPTPEPQVYWGDWLALRLWFIGVVLMWVLQVLDFASGLLRK
jgi:hypothetical protein